MTNRVVFHRLTITPQICYNNGAKKCWQPLTSTLYFKRRVSKTVYSFIILRMAMIRRCFHSITRRKFCQFRHLHSIVDVTKEIRNALDRNMPIVALESTIITHGMPYPNNLDTALEVEEIVRSHDAVPATIAILDGRIKVGLSKESLKYLASGETEAIKCSRRDLSYAVGNKKCGGTTVSGTMVIAHTIGLKIFATGGIGGVHRNGQDTLDISADLIELGRTPVSVVCSGVKSILDIPRTLEFLETQGVCVATYGEANGHFPDFYTRNSGCRVPYNLAGPAEAAKVIKSLYELKMNSGILVAVPIPEAFALNKKLISSAIDEAYIKARNQGIMGKNITPYILEAVSKITKGTSLEANMALIKNNASVAAQIARELYDYKPMHYKAPCLPKSKENVRNVPLVIGASILDLSLTMNIEMPKSFNGATFPAKVKQSAGGVGRNIAEGLFKLHGHVNFISVVGNDELGKSLLQLIPSSLRHSIFVNKNISTSLCSLLFDVNGDCKLILGNMDIHQSITPELVMEHEKTLSKAPLIIIDSNLSEATLDCILKLAKIHGRPVFFEPTDMLIAGKPFFNLPPQRTNSIRIASPNIYELKKIVETINEKQLTYVPDGADDIKFILQQTKEMLESIQNRFDCILVTLGHHGVVVSVRSDFKENAFFNVQTGMYLVKDEPKKHSIRFYPAPRIENIANVSGAGDSLSSGFITGLLRGYTVDRCISLGFEAAKCALQSPSAVPKTYSLEHIPKLEVVTI